MIRLHTQNYDWYGQNPAFDNEDKQLNCDLEDCECEDCKKLYVDEYLTEGK